MQSRPPLPALTGLRFVAASQVLLYHALPHDAGPRWLRPLVASGFVGVSLFFVLSGFILAYNYEDVLRERLVSWPAFWRARFARVYPVYLLGILAGLPPLFLLGRPLGEALARAAPATLLSLPMLQAWSPAHACVVNCPGWSISAEAFFYLVFPAAVVALARVRTASLPWLAAGAWLVALAPPVLYLALLPDGGPVTPASRGWWLVLLKYHPLARVAEFALGMCAGSLFLRRPARAPRWLEPAAAAAIVTALLASRALPYPLLHNGLLAPLFALLIYRLARGDGPLAAWLGGPPWQALGLASYALYILHVPVGAWLAVAFRFTGAAPPPLVRAGLMASLSLAAALLVHRSVEEPARRWLRRPVRPPVREPALAAD